MSRTLAAIVISPLLLAALWLAGCGFELRGTLDLPQSVETVHVIAPPELGNELLALLESGGIDASSSAAEAGAVITVTSERFERRVLSVDPTTGKEREFELAYTVDFSATRGDGETLIDNGSVNLLRDFIFDPGAVIGAGREEELLREEMRRDAARQILRRLEAAFSP